MLMRAVFICGACGEHVERWHYIGKGQKSCGCVYSNTKHGDNRAGLRTKMYTKWLGMRSRCSYKNGNRYHRYGGRGITVCDEWENSYQNFKEWALNNGYDDNLTIDRIDNDGNYEPSNCRFVTNLENSRNTERSKLTKDIVSKIVDMYATGGYTQAGLAKIFDIGEQSILTAIYGGKW